MTHTVVFPGLGLQLELNPIAFTLFGWPIHWYGIIIAAGFLLAVAYCSHISPRFGIRQDDLVDLLIFAVPLGIVGARLYYIIFYLDLYRTAEGGLDWGAMVRIWDGGLAIYGGVIMALMVTVAVFRFKKLPFFAMADVGVFGLLIGQAIGRWGNFVNVEAYGGETTLPWRMGIVEYTASGAARYLEVHPTFLYESLWNLVGLAVLIVVAKKWRKFDGQMFWSYLVWYGVGRGFIEGLRTDSLYFFGTGIRVSQMVGFASALLGAAVLIWMLAVRRPGPERLWVNRQKGQPEQAPEETKEETANDSEDHGR